MKPFLEGCELPMPPEFHPAAEAKVTYQGRVVSAMASGAWFSRREIQQATALTADAVNTVMQHAIRRGLMERELPLRGATKDVVQRYRVVKR